MVIVSEVFWLIETPELERPEILSTSKAPPTVIVSAVLLSRLALAAFRLPTVSIVTAVFSLIETPVSDELLGSEILSIFPASISTDELPSIVES